MGTVIQWIFWFISFLLNSLDNSFVYSATRRCLSSGTSSLVSCCCRFIHSIHSDIKYSFLTGYIQRYKHWLFKLFTSTMYIKLRYVVCGVH